MTENFQPQPTLVRPNRAPISVLAARPRTLAPPPMPIPSTTPSAPTIPTRGIVLGPTIPIVPIYPQSGSTVQSPTRYNYTTSESFNVQREGRLIPIMPIPYESISVRQPDNSNASVMTTPNVVPSVKVVVPTVRESYIPQVIAEVAPQSPPRSPLQSLLRGSIKEIPPPNLPISSIYRQPGTMTGSNPPIGEEAAVLVPVTNYTTSRRGLVAYSTPVDVASFSMSEEVAPLPVEESLRPSVISLQTVPVPIHSRLNERVGSRASPRVRSPLPSIAPIIPVTQNQNIRSTTLISGYPTRWMTNKY